MRHKHLLKFFFLSCGVLIGVIVLINFSVDPYGYFGTGGARGLTARKPMAFQHDRYFKVGLARRTAADCLLAGSSRIGEGLPPSHPALNRFRVLDVSMAGPNVREITSIVQMTEARHHVSLVIVSLDFFSFNALREDSRGGNAAIFTSSYCARLQTAVSLLFSLDTFEDSLATLLSQGNLAFYEPDGTVNQDFLLVASKARATRAGFFRGLRGYIFHHLPAPAHDFKLVTADCAPLADFARFLAEQHKRGIRVVLFFSPAHAWQWELIDALGLWPQWEEWKRELVRINEAQAAFAGKPSFPLWDFAVYDHAAIEPVPLGYETTGALPHYWDSSHFNRLLGSEILDRMFSANQVDDTFGKLLNSRNIDSAIQSNRDSRAFWRRKFPQDHDAIQSLVESFAPPVVLKRLNLIRSPEAVSRRLLELTR